MEEQCKRCGSTLSVDEQEVDFYDLVTDRTFEVNFLAVWCAECGYSKISRV
jgi:predicted nucleic-acid-binding Zn-ribbon protein